MARKNEKGGKFRNIHCRTHDSFYFKQIWNPQNSHGNYESQIQKQKNRGIEEPSLSS